MKFIARKTSDKFKPFAIYFYTFVNGTKVRVKTRLKLDKIKKLHFSSIALIWLIILTSPFVAFGFYEASTVAPILQLETKTRHDQLLTADKNKDIFVDRLTVDSKILGSDELETSPTHWINQCHAHYYRLKTINLNK